MDCPPDFPRCLRKVFWVVSLQISMTGTILSNRHWMSQHRNLCRRQLPGHLGKKVILLSLSNETTHNESKEMPEYFQTTSTVNVLKMERTYLHF